MDLPSAPCPTRSGRDAQVTTVREAAEPWLEPSKHRPGYGCGSVQCAGCYPREPSPLPKLRGDLLVAASEWAAVHRFLDDYELMHQTDRRLYDIVTAFLTAVGRDLP